MNNQAMTRKRSLESPVMQVSSSASFGDEASLEADLPDGSQFRTKTGNRTALKLPKGY